jgi:hypothetical protein
MIAGTPVEGSFIEGIAVPIVTVVWVSGAGDDRAQADIESAISSAKEPENPADLRRRGTDVTDMTRTELTVPQILQNLCTP